MGITLWCIALNRSTWKKRTPETDSFKRQEAVLFISLGILNFNFRFSIPYQINIVNKKQFLMFYLKKNYTESSLCSFSPSFSLLPTPTLCVQGPPSSRLPSTVWWPNKGRWWPSSALLMGTLPPSLPGSPQERRYVFTTPPPSQPHTPYLFLVSVF